MTSKEKKPTSKTSKKPVDPDVYFGCNRDGKHTTMTMKQYEKQQRQNEQLETALNIIKELAVHDTPSVQDMEVSVARRIVGDYWHSRCGGFYHSLFDLWFHADYINKKRVESAFPMLFKEWHKTYGDKLHHTTEHKNSIKEAEDRIEQRAEELNHEYMDKIHDLGEQIRKLKNTAQKDKKKHAIETQETIRAYEYEITDLKTKLGQASYINKPSLKLKRKPCPNPNKPS